MTDLVIASGAHIEVRDAVWRVVQVNQTCSGKAAWHVVGLSEIVRDEEAIFLEEYEPQVNVLDPRETKFIFGLRDCGKRGTLALCALPGFGTCDSALHEIRAEGLVGRIGVVRSTLEAAIAHRGWPAACMRPIVLYLEESAFGAAVAFFVHERALSAVALPHCATHRSRYIPREFRGQIARSLLVAIG